MRIIFLLFSILYFAKSFGQVISTENVDKNIYEEITISKNTINIGEIIKSVKSQYILGFIGKNYQRLRIHLSKIESISSNHHLYYVLGKTKVKSNICDFKGYLKIERIFIAKDSTNSYEPNHYDRIIFGKYEFLETQDNNHSGIFRGEFSLVLNQKRNGTFIFASGIYHDHHTLDFVGTWQKYGTNKAIISCWGIEIPPGQNQFLLAWENDSTVINEKYLHQGWYSYFVTHSIYFLDFKTKKVLKTERNFSETVIEEARLIEEEKWWEE